MLVDDAHRASFLCCAEGAIPLADVRAQLQAGAQMFAHAAGMREPAVYARWLLAQVGMASEIDGRHTTDGGNAPLDDRASRA
jgi:hypothetical protein